MVIRIVKIKKMENIYSKLVKYPQKKIIISYLFSIVLNDCIHMELYSQNDFGIIWNSALLLFKFKMFGFFLKKKVNLMLLHAVHPNYIMLLWFCNVVFMWLHWHMLMITKCDRPIPSRLTTRQGSTLEPASAPTRKGWVRLVRLRLDLDCKNCIKHTSQYNINLYVYNNTFKRQCH